MNWADAMVGATSAVLKIHHQNKNPSAVQRAIRLTLIRINNQNHIREMGLDDGRVCDPRYLKSPKLIVEYKRQK